jgi:hypothetical protein
MFLYHCDIAAARNHSSGNRSEQVWWKHSKLIQEMSWSIDGRDYLNSGVIYFSGNEASVSFSKKWHSLWHQSVNYTGLIVDQLSFNHVIGLSSCKCHILMNTFNSQVIVAPESAWDAAIWHFYISSSESNKSVFNLLTDNSADAPPEKILKDLSSILHRQSPWTDLSPKYLIENTIWGAYRDDQMLSIKELFLFVRINKSFKNLLLASFSLIGIKYLYFSKIITFIISLKKAFGNIKNKNSNKSN